MKKIPCLFTREFTPRPSGHGTDFKITPTVTPGLEWVLAGEGVPTRKYDGTACMVKGGQLYKRYDNKKGLPMSPLAIPCCDPDPTTGHWPHWVPVDTEPESKWHRAAWERLVAFVSDGTYELCGPHFGANPEGFEEDTFIQHGLHSLAHTLTDRSFVGIRTFLEENNIEGIVFWKDGEPRAKIRRDDFGLGWGSKKPR